MADPVAITMQRGEETRQVSLKLRAKFEAEGWVPVGDLRIDSVDGPRTVPIAEALADLEGGNATVVGQVEARRVARKKLEEEMHGDEGFQTFGESGLSALTFGLADPLLEGIAEASGESAGSVAARQRTNEFAATAGTITGTVVGAVAGGGVGNVAKAARFTPAGAASAFSQSLGKAAGRRGAGRGGELIVEGAADGILFGGASQYADAVINDRPVDVENIIASMPSNALFGGATGGAVFGLGKLSNRVKPGKLGPIDDAAERGSQQLVAATNKHDDLVFAGTKIKAQMQLDNAAKSLANKEATAAKRTATAADRSAVTEAKKGVRAAEKEVARIAKEAERAIPAGAAGLTKATSKYVTELSDTVNGLTPGAVQTERAFAGSITKLEKRLEAAMQSPAGAKSADKLSDELFALRQAGPGSEAAAKGLAKETADLVALKESVSRLSSQADNVLEMNTEQFKSFITEFDDIATKSGAASKQDLSKLAEDFPGVGKDLLDDGIEGGLTEHGQLLRRDYGIDARTFNSENTEPLAKLWAARQLDDSFKAVSGKKAAPVLDDLTSEAELIAPRPPVEVAGAKRAERVAGSTAEELAANRAEVALAAREIKRLKTGGASIKKLKGAKPDVPAAEPKARGLGAEIKHLIGSPLRAINQAKDKITKGVAGFIRVAGKHRRGTIPGASAILGRVSFGEDVGPAPKKSSQKQSKRLRQFNKVAAQIAHLGDNPEVAKERVAKGLAELKALKPSIGDALAIKALQRIQFLSGILPRDPNSMTFGPSRWSASNTEIDKFSKILRAAEDPYSLLEDMSHGKLTQEAVDTVKQLYPEIYQSIQMEIVDNIDAIREEVGYEGRLQLGILFQVPADIVLQPEMVQTLQLNFAQREMEREQGGDGSFSTPGAAQKAISNTQTATQRIGN